MELPFGRLDARGAAAGGLAGLERQRRGGDVARGQAIAGGLARRRSRLGQPADQHRIAVEQAAQLVARGFGDLLLAAAGQQPSGKAGDGRVAGGMRRGEPRLAADRGGKLAGDQRDDEQDDDRHDVGDAVDPERVDRAR